MDLTLQGLTRLVIDTIGDPGGVARRLMALNLPRETLWLALALVTVLSVLMAVPMNLLLPDTTIGAEPALQFGPMMYGVVLGASLVLTVFILYYTGSALGGQGRFTDSLALITWLQVVLLALQVVQLLALLLSPLLATFVTFASLAVGLYCLVHFVKEMHRFEGMGRAILTIVLGFLGLGLALSIVLTIAGVGATIP